MLSPFLAGLWIGLRLMLCVSDDYRAGFSAAFAVVEDLRPRDPIALRAEAMRLEALQDDYWVAWAAAFRCAAEDISDPITLR